jgi:hypothetical protein
MQYLGREKRLKLLLFLANSTACDNLFSNSSMVCISIFFFAFWTIGIGIPYFSRDFWQSYSASKLGWVGVNVMILQVRSNSIDVKGY